MFFNSPVRRTTVLGDAAHVMTPFAGVGVNLAMVDALDLSKAIIKVDRDGLSLASALEEYEKSMFTRGALYAQKTWDSLNMLFSGSPAEDIVVKIAAMGDD